MSTTHLTMRFLRSIAQRNKYRDWRRRATPGRISTAIAHQRVFIKALPGARPRLFLSLRPRFMAHRLLSIVIFSFARPDECGASSARMFISAYAHTTPRITTLSARSDCLAGSSASINTATR